MPGTHRPPSHIALAALPGIALDLETTGLDVVHARIVQIGAVAMRDPEVLDAPRIDTRVNPGIPTGSDSTRIHRLTDGDVADAPRFSELIASVVEALAGRVVIGQHIRLDLAALRHESARAGVRPRAAVSRFDASRAPTSERSFGICARSTTPSRSCAHRAPDSDAGRLHWRPGEAWGRRERGSAPGAVAGGSCIDGYGLEWCRGEDLNLHGVAPTWT